MKMDKELQKKSINIKYYNTLFCGYIVILFFNTNKITLES